MPPTPRCQSRPSGREPRPHCRPPGRAGALLLVPLLRGRHGENVTFLRLHRPRRRPAAPATPATPWGPGNAPGSERDGRAEAGWAAPAGLPEVRTLLRSPAPGTTARWRLSGAPEGAAPSAGEAARVDSLPRSSDDSLRTGPGTCPDLARELALAAPLQTASQRATCRAFSTGRLRCPPAPGRPCV